MKFTFLFATNLPSSLPWNSKVLIIRNEQLQLINWFTVSLLLSPCACVQPAYLETTYKTGMNRSRNKPRHTRRRTWTVDVYTNSHSSWKFVLSWFIIIYHGLCYSNVFSFILSLFIDDLYVSRFRENGSDRQQREFRIGEIFIFPLCRSLHRYGSGLVGIILHE